MAFLSSTLFGFEYRMHFAQVTWKCSEESCTRAYCSLNNARTVLDHFRGNNWNIFRLKCLGIIYGKWDVERNETLPASKSLIAHGFCAVTMMLTLSVVNGFPSPYFALHVLITVSLIKGRHRIRCSLVQYLSVTISMKAS